jgi:tetratricopeptide (TPR) repeat protein
MMLQANQPSNEVFMNMFLAWGLALWVRADAAQAGWRHYAAAGLLLGLDTLIKPVLVTVICMALAGVLAGGLNPAALKRRARAIIWVLLPVAAVWGLMVLYFVWQGRAGELYNCLINYGAFYAGRRNNIWMNILSGLTGKLILPCMVFLVPLMMLTALGIWGGLRGSRRPQTLTLVGCLIGTFLAVSIPGWFYTHYYQLYLPILAVGAGWGIATVAGSWRQWALAQMIGAGTLLILLWHVVPDYRFDGKTWSRLKYPEMAKGFFIEVERCGRAVNQMLLPDESFYVWGMDPGVYYYSNRRPASGIFWADRLLVGPLQDPATRKVIAHLEQTRPPLILIEDFVYLEPPRDHPVCQWISENYVKSPETRFSKYFTVYLRRDSALACRLATNRQPFVLTLADVDPLFLKESAQELFQQGRVREAVGYLLKAAEIDPGHPEVDINLAWLLATSSDADIRDGRRAVELAERGCRIIGFKEPIPVGILAAAYAEAGRFEEAIATAQKACALASASGEQNLLKRNQELLALYRAHQPYHQ